MATSNDCDTGARARVPSVEEAIALLLAEARPVDGSETVATADARGRVLAADLASPIDQPAWDNSAMDGYAVRLADLTDRVGRLPVSQRIAAGSAAAPLAAGSAARIFTGAPVPAGADTVIVQEVCGRDGDDLVIAGDVLAGLKAGANIRRRGEDIGAGRVVIPAGTRLGPQHLALAASVGAAQLTVRRRLRVAVIASGSELVMPGSALAPGQIYNSNRFLFHALLAGLGCEVVDVGIVADDRDTTRRALTDAAGRADLVLASGGVSVGDEDHIRPAVEQLGRLHLWQVAMRPGKPLAFGYIGTGEGGGTPFLGSPGNPVSLFVTFCLFARPFLLRMQGVTGPVTPVAVRAKAAFDWPRPDKRREYHRARLVQGADGEPVVEVFESRSSAALTSLAWANGLVVLTPGRVIAAGDPVDFLPFDGLLC